MSKLLRYFSPGQYCFVTSVTHDREPILLTYPELTATFLSKLQEIEDCEVLAWVFLPDHLHMLLSTEGISPSDLMKRAKLAFAYQYRQRKRLYEATIWQRRFWDHVIRDERDLNTHLDYIHYNPVKHGLVSSPYDWQYSSFGKFLNQGAYDQGWGVKEAPKFEGTFGE